MVVREEATLTRITSDLIETELASMKPWMGMFIRTLAARFGGIERGGPRTAAPQPGAAPPTRAPVAAPPTRAPAPPPGPLTRAPAPPPGPLTRAPAPAPATATPASVAAETQESVVIDVDEPAVTSDASAAPAADDSDIYVSVLAPHD